MSTDVIRCWRVSWGVRLGIGVAILAIAPIALISTAMQVDHPISDPITGIVIWAAIWWFGLVRPAVWLSSDELVVRNPLWTHRIARENVAFAKAGMLGARISRRVGRRCIAVALLKPMVAVADLKVDLINYWAQIPRSSHQDEVLAGLFPEGPRRSRVGELVAAAALAVVFVVQAILLAWPRHPSWLFPAAVVVTVLALIPLALTQPRRPRTASSR
ncbi:hypothetical protein [Kribbella sp. NPDC004536]|uniref:hypothetical protein n=1 Tax=Kribbella sp. NPDC004536 TaxID=3364106 RepID=UPI0036A39BA6